MGLSASQIRALFCTHREADIKLQQTQISNQRLSLARDMQKISKEYHDALNKRILKWSNNAGASYIDLSYNNLMTPSAMNQNKSYLLTDMNGRVVIDKKYQEYAEMISANGKPGGDWSSIRTQVLSSITGIDANKINSVDSSQLAIWDNEDIINDLLESKPLNPTNPAPITTILGKLGNSTGFSTSNFSNGKNWQEAYSSNATINLGNIGNAKNNFKSITDYIANNLSKYFDDPENIKNACQNFYDMYSPIIGGSSEDAKTMLSSETSPIKGNILQYTINVTKMIEQIMGNYSSASTCQTCECDGYAPKYNWNDVDSAQYQTYLTNLAEWQKKYDAATETYDSSVDNKNTLLTSEEEKQIEFYDELFSSIAEKGWTYNNKVKDTEYLNQMLQNNLYTITTVDRSVMYDNQEKKASWKNFYETDIASNFNNIFTVNDSNAQNDALAEYEYKKSIINAKETRLDTRSQDLQTELSAIKQMIESLESIRNDNIERNFKIFG